MYQLNNLSQTTHLEPSSSTARYQLILVLTHALERGEVGSHRWAQVPSIICLISRSRNDGQTVLLVM